MRLCQKSKLINIINKGSSIIYQSKFSQNCFNNIYESLPDGKIIYNGVGELRKEDPRIIIPFFDRNKNLVAAQGRSVENSTLRYFTIKIDKKASKIFGLDRWDDRQVAYMTEGPFDSMFLPNAMAMAGSDIDDISLFMGKNVVFI